MSTQNLINRIKSALFGVAVGDAVGVPYEFRSRLDMVSNPATDMIGYGTYNLPPGSWSDDSSLTFCLTEAFCSDGYSLKAIARTFTRWVNEAFWTPYGRVFDIGVTTAQSIRELEVILDSGKDESFKNLKHKATEFDNGNGSLMRILPLLFYIKDKSIQEQFEIIYDVSSLTHKHIRAAMACLIYLTMARNLMDGLDKITAYEKMRKTIQAFWETIDFQESERFFFVRVIQQDIQLIDESDIKSSGYVIDVLEAAFYFLLRENSYKDTILKIINLGNDTDTAAAIAGGLAGLHYGYDKIPNEWIHHLARKSDIEDLAARFGEKISTLV